MLLNTDPGQLLMVGFDGTSASEASELLERLRPCGVILFARNIASRQQVAQLTAGLQEQARRLGLPPLLISIDQEGGRVQRLGPGLFPQFPSNAGQAAEYQRTGNAAHIADQARQTAAALLELGINMNLAPVLDVVTAEGNEVISDRAYGSDPGLVARLGCEYISALQASGVIASAKHFPGHGATAVDSHYELPTICISEEEFRDVHLPPFRRAFAEGVATVMTAHIVHARLEPCPATLSRPVLTGLLRGELGFDGAIITDDLNMKAIAAHYEPGETALRALNAGADILLVCKDPAVQQTMRKALYDACATHSELAALLDAATARIGALRTRFGL